MTPAADAARHAEAMVLDDLASKINRDSNEPRRSGGGR